MSSLYTDQYVAAGKDCFLLVSLSNGGRVTTAILHVWASHVYVVNDTHAECLESVYSSSRAGLY